MEFRYALEADPAFPYRWADLGDALAQQGKKDEAARSFRRAVELAPDSPQIAIRAANFWFTNGSAREGLALESKVLAQVPDFDQMIFRSWIRMAGDTGQILAAGIGSNPRAARAFFDFLIANGDRESLTTAWNWLETRRYTASQQSRAWVEWLLHANDPGRAAQIWASHVATSPAEYGKSNWVDNSGFEAVWTGSGFDWTALPCPGVNVSVDRSSAHTGARSLRLDFNSNENLDFHHFFQRTWLLPGKYRLEGWIRASELTTDQGVGLRVMDPAHESELNIVTPNVTGTAPWTHVSQEFVVAGHARLLEIQIFRKPSFAFDNHPHGTAWVDDVRIEPM